MHDMATRQRALALHSSGLTLSAVSRITGVSRSAIREWMLRIEPLPGAGSPCPLEGGGLADGIPRSAYSYLLGLYLGDGCISEARRGVHVMRIACADAWPGLIEACADALSAVMPGSRVNRARHPGCTSVVSCSKHWPCLFPRHGQGPKHLRTITLSAWQQRIVDTHPWELLRGLVHSDGCRITNWTTRKLKEGIKRYEYPRYFFTNKSADIRRLFTDTLDALGVAWKPDGPYNISVARRGPPSR